MRERLGLEGACVRLDTTVKRLTAMGIALALLVAALGLMQALGFKGRRYLPAQVKLTATGAQQGYDLIRDTGVKGRILVLFDRTSRLDNFEQTVATGRLRAGLTTMEVSPGELVAQLIYIGAIRRVYIVFPQSEWPRVDSAMTRIPTSRKQGEDWFSRYANGVPVTLTTTPPKLSERAIVYISGSVESSYSPGAIAAATAPEASDLVVVQRP
jgi:hypothetical protein